MSDLILASKSSVRATILRAAGVEFRAVNSEVDEEASKAALLKIAADPAAIAMALAEEKATVVSRREPGLVIGADQTLELDGALHDKPASLKDAHARLLALRGRTHALHAAVCLARDGAVIWRRVETVRLAMRDFSADFLERYLAEVGPQALDSVGAYQFEGLGAQLFEAAEGDYFAILGLPLLPLLGALRDAGALST